MADMMVLAFQTDTTRIGTFIFANEGSNRSYAFMDVPRGTTTSRTTAATRRSRKRSPRSTASTWSSSPTSSAR